MTMVKRVAKAIYEGTPRNKPYDQLSAFKRRAYEAEARAAILAMREPTEAQLAASYEWPDNISANEPYPHALGIWRAMIDEALQENDG